ncbi:Reticulocyte-binding protein 2 like protein a [Madurella fahalii]|uniref:Reticulocyte-binding protein 2 like protein a n=1 Tax=Madurella fahalii TaxID=1157608 RepID=A0ABQ0G1Z8_9PEZI
MADLLGGAAGPATTNGHGASSSRPTAPPAQTGSPQQVIRGPRVIMRERAEREARQRAEREQMERARAEEEARLLEETARRHAVAGAGAVPGGGDLPTDPATQRRQQRAQEAQGSSRIPTSVPPVPPPGSATVPPLRPTRVPATAQMPQNFTSASQPGPGASVPAQAGEPSAQGMAPTRLKNSFPHAFERWEALSAHWEGMTSFWLRRLQENTDEVERNPITSQLSRQVHDLSAAGANLFHAVVELQRLRASSERKFQRWFFETRAELERNQEVNAMLEAQMEQERQARADAVRGAAQHEAENMKLQKMVSEMRRELLISKEEARRAWEELGRREQEERDRTVSLQQGHPTIVGGVQVVPMSQGVPSRNTSRRERSHSQAADTSEYVAAQGGQYSDYTGAAPAPIVQPAATSTGDQGAGFYQQTGAAGREAGEYGAGSEAAYSEGEYVMDVRGNFVRDEHGNKIPYHSPTASPSQRNRARRSDAAVEDYEAAAPQQTAPPTSYPPSSSHWAAGTYAGGSPEYSGQSYAAPGWESMPRHHHPTRLSDVMEEDERSRTSVSQVSRA